MATVVYCTGFEHGLATPVTTGGGLFSSISGTGCSIQATTKRTGGYALKCLSTAATQASVTVPTLTSHFVQVGRFYILFHSWPVADDYIFNQGATSFYIEFVNADKTLRPGYGATKGNKSAALSLDTWYRIDYRIDASANPNLFDMQVGGTAIAQLSQAQAATSMVNAQIGMYSSGIAAEAYYDDFAISVTSTDYPLGAGGVVGLPAAAGTAVSNPSTYMQDQDGTVVHDTTNPAYVELDEIPIASAEGDYIRQTTTGTDLYAATRFAQTTETVIQGVMAILAYNSATATENNGQTRIIDIASQETTVYSGDMSETTIFYKSIKVKVPTAPSPGWSKDHVNALIGRVGYSADAAPDPFWESLMLEVAYGTAIPWVPKVIFIG